MQSREVSKDSRATEQAGQSAVRGERGHATQTGAACIFAVAAEACKEESMFVLWGYDVQSGVVAFGAGANCASTQGACAPVHRYCCPPAATAAAAWSLLPPACAAAAFCRAAFGSTVKDSPQPQVPLAFGLMNMNSDLHEGRSRRVDQLWNNPRTARGTVRGQAEQPRPRRTD